MLPNKPRGVPRVNDRRVLNGIFWVLRSTAGEAHDNRLADKLLSRLKSGTMLLADRGYNANWIRAFAAKRNAGCDAHARETVHGVKIRVNPDGWDESQPLNGCPAKRRR